MTDKEMATAYALEWGNKTDGTYACSREGFLAGLKADRATAKQRLDKAKKMIRNLLYVYQLKKNEPATARVMAEAEQFLKETEE